MYFDGRLDGLRVDHGALDTAAVGMKRIVAAIEQVLDDLAGDLRPLLDQWDGETKLAFYECERSWSLAMTELKDVLDSTHTAIAQSNDEFRSVDLRNAATFEV